MGGTAAATKNAMTASEVVPRVASNAPAASALVGAGEVMRKENPHLTSFPTSSRSRVEKPYAKNHKDSR